MDRRLAVLERVVAGARKFIDPELPIQQLALFLLVARAGEDGVTMPEAVSALQMGQTSVSKNAKSLGKFAEHHGNVVTIKGLELIAVAPDLRERRRLCMTLTPKGRRVLATLLERLALPEREPERGDDERISEG